MLALSFDVSSPGAEAGAALLAAFFFACLLAVQLLVAAIFFQLLAEFESGEVAVHFARPVSLTFDFDLAREVLEIDAGAGFVDLLPAASGAADEFLKQVVFDDSQRGHSCLEGGFFLRRDHRFFMAAR